MRIGASQRAALVEAFRQVDPTAPTLCEGWTAHDLAVHVWLREHEPFSLAGTFIPAFAGRTRARTDEVKAERSYAELVDAFAAGPGRWSPVAVASIDDLVNAMEYFIHCEDIRRGEQPWSAREIDRATADWAWSQTRVLAKLKLRRAPVSLVLENLVTGEALRLGRSSQVVTVAGSAEELLLWLSGRRAVAQVTYHGAPDDLARLDGLDLGL